MLEETQSLANIELSKGVKRLVSKKKHHPPTEDFNRAVKAFKFALEVPPAVLSRTSREELLRRAFIADIICMTALDRSHVRGFIARHGNIALPALVRFLVHRCSVLLISRSPRKLLYAS